VPLFPFNLLNYALGLTRIRFLPYVLASLVFMLPGALAYTYLGFAGREAIAGEGLIRNGLIALALLAAVAFLPRLVARLRQCPMLPIEPPSRVCTCRSGSSSRKERPSVYDTTKRTPPPTS
jgi:hypothetical protein